MLKERKVIQSEYYWDRGDGPIGLGKDILGWYWFDPYGVSVEVKIEDDDTKAQINEEEYFFTEFSSVYEGVLLAFNLNPLDTTKYFGLDYSGMFFNEKEFLELIEKILRKYNLIRKNDDFGCEYEISIGEDPYLRIILLNKKLEDIKECSKEILEFIREYYQEKNVHITRMFGSYILLANEKEKLKAIEATNIPIEYCPLMYKLLYEVGGETALKLISALQNKNKEEQRKILQRLINEVVIDGGYFATDRPLNSCEANVLFGASETISSAFKSQMIDAAVIVSNNLGTIITTNANTTQGAVKRMTGLFYTSPSKELIEQASKEGIIPVFPYTAEIDQVEGVKKAISLGYKRIAVTVAAGDNYLLKELNNLETEGITLYKFGLCSTGINEETASIMRDYADVVWSCASKSVKEYIEPNAILQVGVKIPVHIMTKKGSEIIKNHLQYMYEDMYEEKKMEFALQKGNDKDIIVNDNGQMRVLKKKDLHHCSDCPHPCI